MLDSQTLIQQIKDFMKLAHQETILHHSFWAIHFNPNFVISFHNKKNFLLTKRQRLLLLKYICIISLWIFLTANVFPQNHLNNKSSLIIGGNYRIYPSSVTQTEVFIVKSPVDENVLFSSGNTLNFIPFFISEGIYVTTNGGNSLQGSDTCKGDPIDFHGGDP